MDLLEMNDGNVCAEPTPEEIAAFEGADRDFLIKMLVVYERLTAGDDGPREDMGLVLGLHERMPHQVEDGRDVHYLRRAIKLIGELSKVPRSAEMDEFYLRGGSEEK